MTDGSEREFLPESTNANICGNYRIKKAKNGLQNSEKQGLTAKIQGRDR